MATKPNVWSKRSENILKTCHKDLQKIMDYVLEYVDISIICGFRDKVEQDKAFDGGFTQVQFPDSEHNISPSNAVDVIPYPEGYKSHAKFYYIAGIVEVITNILHSHKVITHKVRWGGDWDRDKDFSDQKFNDLAHFELVEE